MLLLLVPMHAVAADAMVAPAARPADKSSAIDERANDKATCDRKWARYYKSQECFAPYHNVDGTMKPGAFRHCKQIRFPAECPLQPPNK